jgi:hypothetical protein
MAMAALTGLLEGLHAARRPEPAEHEHTQNGTTD